MKKTGTQAEALTQAQVVLLENEVISRNRHPDRFRLINNQYNALQSWHDQHTGWRIRRTPASIRLIRTPVSFIPGYVFQTLQQPRDFACFVWALWYAETRLSEGGGSSNGQQFLMSHLAERLEEQSATGYLAAHVAPFDFKRLSDRYSLVRALKTLQELGGLHLEDGSAEEWVNQTGQENALYEFSEITRSLILALDMEQVRLAARTLQGNPIALTPARLPGTEKINGLQRAWRSLLLGPALLKYDDPEAFEALREHQETFNFELGQTYGWQLDLRYEYAMIIRPSGTGLGPVSLLNLGGAADQAALLCCEAIRQKTGSGEWKYPATDGCRFVPESEIAEIFRQVREEYGSRWGSTARKTSFQELLQDVYAKLRQAGLMRGPDRSGNVLLLPTMARFGVSYPPEEEIILPPPQPAMIEQPQQLAFDSTPAALPNQGPNRAGQPPASGYNTVQAGRILGVSDQSILNWLNTGFLKGERQGRGWIIPAAEVERMKALRWGTAPKAQASPPDNFQNASHGQTGQPAYHNESNGVNKEAKPANSSGERGYNSYEAARWLGVANSTIINWLKNGKLNAEKTGLIWSIPLSELERMKEVGWGAGPKSRPSLQNNYQDKSTNRPEKTSSHKGSNGVNKATNKPASPGGQRGYNTVEAARLLGVGDVTILNWLKKGKLKGEKIGLTWSIPASEIENAKATRGEATNNTQNGNNGATKEVKPAGAGGEPNYNATEARRLLGVAETTILRWLRQGTIKADKIDSSWAIPASEIERLKLPGPGVTLKPPNKNNGQPARANLQNGSNRAAKETKPAGTGGEQGYSAAETGRLLGVSEVTILYWLKKGKINGQKTGLRWSIPAAEIERIQNSRG